MPIYDFECTKCSKQFDRHYQTISEYETQKPNLKCPFCESDQVNKLISTGTTFILKGNGWTGKLNPRRK